MEFKEFDIAKADFNPFKTVGKDWMLITAGDEKGFNTMTVSWGGFGIMWHKNVSDIVIRPQRHTLGFIENSDYYTISLFDEKYRDTLTYCGRHSGRDVDKVKETGLTPKFIDGTTAFEEAHTILVCKKLYRQELTDDCFIDKSLLSNYESDNFHISFVGEITKALKK